MGKNQKITTLQTPLTEEEKRHDKIHQMKTKHRQRRRFLVIGLIFGALFVVIGTQTIQANSRLNSVNRKIAKQDLVLQETTKKKNEYKIQASQLKDEDYVLKLIRQKYYWSKKGETIYSLPEDKSKSLFKETDVLNK